MARKTQHTLTDLRARDIQKEQKKKTTKNNKGKVILAPMIYRMRVYAIHCWNKI